MKGEVSYISKTYNKANNKNLKSYDPKQESKHIIYLDANNSYGFTMGKYFPTGELKWVDPKEFGLNKYTKHFSRGCVLEVDLEYPKE